MKSRRKLAPILLAAAPFRATAAIPPLPTRSSSRNSGTRSLPQGGQQPWVGKSRRRNGEGGHGMTISRKSAPAGVVTFKTTNISKEMIHELVFVRYPEPGKATPLAIAT